MRPKSHPTQWLGKRHSPAAETTLIVGFYALYESARGLVAGARQPALHRAHSVADIERRLHLFEEPRVQQFAARVPGLLGTLDVAYLTLHLTVTLALLIWLYTRHPRAFPMARTALIVASVLSLIGFLILPTAPPRMAGLGMVDTVSRGAVDLNHGLVSSVYNPYAAIPSMHVGYAVIVGVATFRWAGRGLLRAAGMVYPIFVLFVIVATGNHFFLDAAAGALVASFAVAAAVVLQRAEKAKVLPMPSRHPASRERAPGRAA